MKKTVSILLAVVCLTTFLVGCGNKTEVSQEDLSNSHFLEWSSRFRASNTPEISITAENQATRGLIGNELNEASKELESILRELTAENLGVCSSENTSENGVFLSVANSVAEYRFYITENENELRIVGMPEAVESFLSENEFLIVKDSNLYGLVCLLAE